MSILYKHLNDTSIFTKLSNIGIYKITHTAKPEVFYIGSASRIKGTKLSNKGFYKRFLEHLRALTHNKHSSKYLQHVVNKYGIAGIRFEIIEVLPNTSKSIILTREQHYLDTLKPKYNSSKHARCPTVPYTEERRKKISERFKGRKLPKEIYDKLKVPMFQFTKEGVLLKKYESIQEASSTTNIDRASISNTASGKRKSAGGYLWSYTSTVKVTHALCIYQYTLEGKFVQLYNTLEDVKRKLNINTSTAIRNCFSGKQKKAYGYKWIKAHPEEARELGYLL